MKWETTENRKVDIRCMSGTFKYTTLLHRRSIMGSKRVSTAQNYMSKGSLCVGFSSLAFTCWYPGYCM